MYEHIARRSVVIAFHASLGVDAALHFLQLVEYVEGISAECELAFQERSRQTGVPHKVVVVHRSVLIAAAAIDCKVCVKLKFPWQRHRAAPCR